MEMQKNNERIIKVLKIDLKIAKKKDSFIFQKIDDTEQTEIVIKFKKGNILETIDVLCQQVYIIKKNFSIKFNNKNLEIQA